MRCDWELIKLSRRIMVFRSFDTDRETFVVMNESYIN